MAVVTAILIILTIPVVSAQSENTKDGSAGNKSAPQGLRLNEKAADMDFTCPYRKGYEHPARYGGFTVRLLKGPKAEADRCRATESTSGRRPEPAIRVGPRVQDRTGAHQTFDVT